MLKDGKGMHMKKVAEKNRRRIVEWIEKHPNGTRTECCNALGITYKTLRIHLKSIQKESE